MTYEQVLLTLNFILIVAYFIRKELVNHRAEQQNKQVWDVLQLIKGWQESGRIHRVEAKAAEAKVAEVANTVTETVHAKTEELSHQIEAVPQKVAEVIKSTDSGSIKLP